MEILGIGPLELLFIILIALIVLGPNDMVKAGRTVGKFMRKIVMSPSWRTFQQASRDLRYLPNKLIREAGLEELEQDVKTLTQEVQQVKETVRLKQFEELNKSLADAQEDISSWTTPPASTPNRDSTSNPPQAKDAAKDPPTESEQA